MEREIIRPMDLWATNIEWDVDMETVFEILDDMDSEDAAKVLSCSASELDAMEQDERDDFVRDYFHHCPGALYDILNLKEEIRIPSMVVKDVEAGHYDYADWLSNTYGYCICQFDLQNRERKTLLEAIDDGSIRMTDVWHRQNDGFTECYFEAPTEFAENKMDRFNISDEDIQNFKASEIQITLNTTDLQSATIANITDSEIGPVIVTDDASEVVDITYMELTEEEAEALLRLMNC